MPHATNPTHTHPLHYLVACGGTGGHLAPGIALAEGLAARGHRATLLISPKKVDTRLSEKYPGLTFIRVPSAPFSLNPLRLLAFLLRQTHGLLFSLALIRKTRPALIIGFGGFTTASIILAGWLTRVPIALHEANRVPGRAIRLLAPLARRIYLPPGVTLSNNPKSKIQNPKSENPRVRPMGLPVRAEIHREPRDTARAALDLLPDHPVLVILGGSQGAAPLTAWAAENAPALAQENIQLYIITGLDKDMGTQASRLPPPAGGTTSVSSSPTAPIQNPQSKIQNPIFTPFSDRMATLLSAADLVVTRAGAGTIAELIRCATPAILIPYPHAADNHQQANALYHEQQGGGILVPQTRLDTLHREVLDTIHNDWLLRKFRENLQRMDRANSLPLLLNDLEQLAPADVAQAAEPARSPPPA